MSSGERQTPQLIVEYFERLAHEEKYRQLTDKAREILEQEGTTYPIEYRVSSLFMGRSGMKRQNLRLTSLIPSSSRSTLINIYGFPETKSERVDDPILVYPVHSKTFRHVVLGNGKVAGGPWRDWGHGYIYSAIRETEFDLPFVDFSSGIDLTEKPAAKNILVPWKSVYYNPHALEIGNLSPEYLDRLLELLDLFH